MKYKLEDLFTLRREAPSSGHFLIVNGDDFISNSPFKLANYNYAEFPNERLKKSGYTYLFRKGDILFLTVGAKKKVWIADQEGICASGNNKIKIIANQKEVVCPEWLCHMLISEKVTNWAFDCLTGTTVPQINWKSFLRKIKVNVPDLNEQKAKIYAFFQLENWNSKVKSLVKKMTSLIFEIFIENTKVQAKAKVKDICFVNPPEKYPLLNEDLVSFLLLEDLESDSVYVQPRKTSWARDKKGYKYFQENDLLLAKISPSFENGKLSIAKKLENGIGLGSTEFIIIRTKESVSAEWIYYCLKNPIFIQEGVKTMRGTGQQRIKADFVNNWLIPFPSLEEQKNLLLTLRKMENFVVKMHYLSKLINSFLQHLHAIVVKEAEIEIN